jgi:hypothetical protein
MNAPAPWGDYGRVLVSGLTARPESDGRVPVERTGPFVPPITIAGISDLLVTDAFREALAGSGLRGFSYREAAVKRVVSLDWQAWDLNAAEPEKYPAGGEPENYVLRRKHNPAAASAVGRLWEVVMDQKPEDQGEADLVRSAPTRFSRVLASDAAKAWLTDAAGDWLLFEPHLFEPQDG